MAVDSLGRVYVTGRTSSLQSSVSGDDIYLKRFFSNGVEDSSYLKIMEEPSVSSQQATGLVIDSEDSVYVLMNSMMDGLAIRKYLSDGTNVTTNWNSITGPTGAIIFTSYQALTTT